jgi:hypothetical protein
MMSHPIPTAVRCALCDVVCSHDISPVRDDREERASGDASP